MKSTILSLFLLLAKGCLSVTIFPQIADQILLPDPISGSATDRTSFTRIEVNETHSNTIIHNMSTLQDELSYNCLSKHFTLAFIVPAELAVRANFNLNSSIFYVTDGYDLANVVGSTQFPDIFSGEVPTEPWLAVFKGEIVEADGRIVIQKTELTTPGFIGINTTIEGGTVNRVPILDYTGQDFIFMLSLVNWAISEGSRGVTATALQNYLNELFLTTSMTDLVQMNGGSCRQEGSRGAIFPELPALVQFEPITSGYNDSVAGYMSIVYNKTVRGLEDSRSELSYNCLTGTFELAVHVVNVSMGGTFELILEEKYSTFTNISVTGTIKEKCSESIDESCLFLFEGVLEEKDGGLVTPHLFYRNYIPIEYTFLDGTINGAPVNATNEWLALSRLESFHYEITDRYKADVEAYFNGVVQDITMAQLIEMTGGSSNCLEAVQGKLN